MFDAPLVTRARSRVPGPRLYIVALSGRMQLKRKSCVLMDSNTTSETSSVAKMGYGGARHRWTTIPFLEFQTLDISALPSG